MGDHLDPRQVLQRTAFFTDVLDAAQLATLAAGMRIVDYRKGATIIREDDLGTSMFVVAAGAVIVNVPDGGQSRRVATLRDGDIFGEMSLLTGARRAATVVAESAATVLEIPKAALSPLIEASPGLADRFAAMLATRQGELDRIYGSGGAWQLLSGGGADLAGLIRRFFRSAA